MKRASYYFDKIQINSYDSVGKLRYLEELLPRVNVLTASEAAQRWNYRSRVEITVPTPETFALLKQHLLPETYKITYLEISRDRYFESRNDAYYSSRKAIDSLSKKYSTAFFVFDASLSKKKGIIHEDDKLFSDRTGYLGGYGFKYVIYARDGKVYNMPCRHDEWRISGSSKIWQKCRVKNIDDLIGMDIADHFIDLDERYISYDRIDHERFGKFLLGWGKRKKFTQRQIGSCQLAGFQYCMGYGITSFSGLRKHIDDEKKRIKAKPGVRSAWDKKILAIRTCKRFAQKSV